jgi:hypothetical protein
MTSACWPPASDAVDLRDVRVIGDARILLPG